MAKDKPIIRLEKVYKAFNGQVVLDGLNLDVERGKTTVIIGPSGCGKSVLIKHMNGLLKPDRGTVEFDGRPISKTPERRLMQIRRRIGFLFQGGALFDSMTVAQNVMFPLEEHDVGSPASRLQRCQEVLALVGMEGNQDKFPEELSGGQKKRIALARAIVLNPEIILYDEPTAGLDPIRADLINELILRLQQVLKTTAVVVTHDMASARKVGDRIIMLHQGHFIADAAPDRLGEIKNETVKRFIEGRASDEELKELEVGQELMMNNKAKPKERKE